MCFCFFIPAKWQSESPRPESFPFRNPGKKNDTVTFQQAFELAVEHHQSGRLAEAEAIYRQLLTVAPQDPNVLRLLGAIALHTGQLPAALDLCTRAIASDPAKSESYNELGNVHFIQGQFDLAMAAYRAALDKDPGSAEAHYNLGNTLTGAGQLPAAVAAYREAIRLQPNHARACNNLGAALFDLGQFAPAAEAYLAAIRLQPSHVKAHMNLGNALLRLEQSDAAIDALRTSIRMDPNDAYSYLNLGNAFKEQGRLAEALEAYQVALALAPGDAGMHSNLVYTSHFLPNLTPEALAEEHRHWQRRHAEPLAANVQPHDNERSPDRRLRVGYVSSDFCDHVVGRNLVPLFRHHDTQRFEIVCYSHGLRSDAMTARFRALATEWHKTNGLTDEQLAARIREDHIDILVDLNLHMAGSRLLVFARKPAPVQVTFAGYPGTTGLEAIDYRLTDSYLDPAGLNDEFYSEESIRLESFWCFVPDDDSPPVSTPPAMEKGFVTFGCLNAFSKVNDRVIELWSRVLGAVGGAHLLILSPLGEHRERMLLQFEQLGIARERVEFVRRMPRPHYLALYDRLDIILDTFPYNGHSTTLDALWMGVPVVSLAGKTTVSRGGLSILSNVGLPELVAYTDDAYVRITTELASDVPRLAALRATLRAKMQASVLMDAPRFARHIEAAYRTLWQRWCAEKKPSL